jgi:hypothetical protein
MRSANTDKKHTLEKIKNFGGNLKADTLSPFN